MGNDSSSIPRAIPSKIQIKNDIKIELKKVSTTTEKSSGRHSHASCTVGDRCYVFGGVIRDGDDERETADLLVFNKGIS